MDLNTNHSAAAATARSCALYLLIAAAISAAASADDAGLPREASLIAELQRENLSACAQGDRNVCSLFAITGLAEVESVRGASGHGDRFSEEYLIWAARKFSGNEDGQAMFYQALDGLEASGICTEARMPYTAKTDAARSPSPEAIAEAETLRDRWRAHWVKLWSLEAPLTEVQLTEIKRALADGHAVACGLRWPKHLRGSELFEVPGENDVFDGHSIMLVGYEDDASKPGGGILRFRNSFGARWGEEGYGAMSYAYASAYANDALWLQLEAPGAETPVFRYEAEDTTVEATGNCNAGAQKMNEYGRRMWSAGKQLFCRAEKDGYIELRFDVQKAVRYRLRVLATAAPDYGKVRFAVDGNEPSREFDLYSGRISPAGSLELGDHDLGEGSHRLRITCTGKNEASKGYCFGLDTIDLLETK
ncbi:MAG TPA: C1 family peptidase [Chthoniobacteraceae bacterium]|jgi:hypothetical protein